MQVEEILDRSIAQVVMMGGTVSDATIEKEEKLFQQFIIDYDLEDD